MNVNQDQNLDLTHLFCPMTFVHARLALDRMNSGESLRIRLADGEARRNVAASMRALGHVIEDDTSLPDGSAQLRVRKSS